MNEKINKSSIGNKYELLHQIKEEVLNFKDSPLYQERIQNKVFPVIGEGSHEAKIMFIGEAPGKNEAATGRPFCGAAGKILTELIESIGLTRENVYITNIVKDRPPNNRDPLDEEIKIYAPFLDRQIEIIQPNIIATLGRYSMAYIMNKFGLLSEVRSISQIHGKVFEVKNPYGEIYPVKSASQSEAVSLEAGQFDRVKIIPLYHPAVALYQNNLKEQMFKDFQILKKHS